MVEESYIRTVALMGTVVTVRVPSPAIDPADAVARAFDWFRLVEQSCTRFEPGSEVMQLAAQPGVAVPVSTILFEAVQFALAVAEESEGAFDPTVGHAMETRGFNQEYRTRKNIHTPLEPTGPVSYRDVQLDAEHKTITLQRPLILDLGAVAKGLAIDLATRELKPFENFVIDAGGDLYLGGRNPSGNPWSIGIRHPRRLNELIDSVQVTNRAVCTSGDYERPSASDSVHHILDPRTNTSPHTVASATVIAPNAMLADAVATAAFVLGPTGGLQLCERLGVEGLIFSPTLDRYATPGMVGAHAS